MIDAIPEHLKDTPFRQLPQPVLAAAAAELAAHLSDLHQAGGVLLRHIEVAYAALQDGDVKGAKAVLKGPALDWWSPSDAR